jgi:hypothetical protein
LLLLEVGVVVLGEVQAVVLAVIVRLLLAKVQVAAHLPNRL